MFELHPQLAKDTWLLSQLPLCSLLLSRDALYPWLILVPRQPDIREIFELDALSQQQLWQESNQISRLLQQAFQPDKLNIAALGNMVPQLHLHQIARFSSDAAWPAPVWGRVPAKAYSNAELQQRLQALNQASQQLGYSLSLPAQLPL